MGTQSWLVLLMLVILPVVLTKTTTTSTEEPPKKHIAKADDPLYNKMLPNQLNFLHDDKIPMADNPLFNKMLPNLTENEIEEDDILKRKESFKDVDHGFGKKPLFENSKPIKVVAITPKPAAVTTTTKSAKIVVTPSNKAESTTDDSYEYSDEYDDDEKINFDELGKIMTDKHKDNSANSNLLNKLLKISSTSPPAVITTTTALPLKEIINETNPVKIEELDDSSSYEYNDNDNIETIDFDEISKLLRDHRNRNKKAKDEIDNETDADYTDGEYDELDDDYSIEQDAKSCPRDCICEKNMHAYLVATCSRLDVETQKFSSVITDLQVLDIPPKYPIVLGEDFFKKLGLTRVSSIKISNCTIEYISKTAFSGLTKLYSVNLTNTGIDMIHPDTFVNNTELKLLTLSGNNLHAMQQSNSPFADYMIKSQSIEELHIAKCNLNEILPTAFDELRNIDYINLAGNGLKTLPSTLFDKVDTIEELDLSGNRITKLPKNIFKKTSLAILNLKQNEITANFDFITKDLQKLDLSECKIRTINGQMFEGMEGLTNLILKGNHIKKIQPMAFATLKNLRHIDLSHNDLEQISALTFIGNQKLDVIKLNDNPRLKKLPSEGFVAPSGGKFDTYYIDISNCDINEIGDKVFSTMPQLTRINLSWNNIQAISVGVFSYLNKLMDLDLSNNLITDIDELTFLHNTNLNKLILSGNPIERLSLKTFLPIQYLTELDISDCDLRSLWDSKSVKQGTKVLENLKLLNVSYNEIKTIHHVNLETLVNLKVLDITNNPMVCDQDFKNLIKWLGQKKVSLGGDGDREKAEIKLLGGDNAANLLEWSNFAKSICMPNKQEAIGHLENLEDDDDDDEEDDDDLDEDMENENEFEDDKENAVDSKDHILDDDEYIYDDEDEDNTDEKDILTDAANAIQSIDDAILGGKRNRLEDEEIIIEEPIFASYRYLWPILIIVFSALAVMLLVAKVISMMMQKRGERYRQALLASKNNIVYQKLSEDIYAPTTPKFIHTNSYTPISQV
uniref:Membrane glycoprotein lig-1 n=1 Tax=Corethrella appendiculata TaxID=1370023 RepID=U5EPU2_9DIPT